MNRIHHPWHLWEDYKYNFYDNSTLDKEAVNKSVYVLKNLHVFEKALKHIINNWKYSCEQNLTNENLNKIAYLGQASCAYLYNIPQTITMKAWSELTKEEQENANNLALKYLNIWLNSNNKEK
jgi:hypothetical protein